VNPQTGDNECDDGRSLPHRKQERQKDQTESQHGYYSNLKGMTVSDQ
jgi:hypothetical protein